MNSPANNICFPNKIDYYVTTLTASHLPPAVPALQAEFNYPQSCLFLNSTYVLIVDSYNNVIKGLDLTTGTVYLLAGTFSAGYKDGFALNASFSHPSIAAYDAASGLIYISDTSNSIIRMLNVSSRIVSTLAGNGFAGFLDGPASLAEFFTPYGLALDSSNGMLYIADSKNYRIRSFNFNSGNVSTIAGGATSGYLNGPALQAEFLYPFGLALDPSNGNIYISDTYNTVIRLLNMTSGNVSTIAGSGAFGFSDGPASLAEFNDPYGIALDSSNGILYISDSNNNRIRAFNFNSGNVYTIAGNGLTEFLDGPSSLAEFNIPYGIALDSSNGNVFVADSSNQRIRLINMTSGNVSTIAGNGFTSFNNGPISQALFNLPFGIIFDPTSGNIFVSDQGNNMIRMINMTSGIVSTIAGSIGEINTAPALQAAFLRPAGIAFDSINRNLYIADSGNCLIRLFNITTSTVSIFAGSTLGYFDGPVLNAQFFNPYGIALDPSNGNVFVADSGNNVIRLINATSSTVSTIAGYGSLGYYDGPATNAEFDYPYSLAFDSANRYLYIADTDNSAIRLLNMTSAQVSTVAGNGYSGYFDGPASSALFSYPRGIAFNATTGNLYIADSGNNAIRIINLASGNVSTFAGNGYSGNLDGPALQAEFNFPSGIAFDPSNGDFYVADMGNNRIALSEFFCFFLNLFEWL